MRYFLAIFVFACVAVISLAGFRGQKFTRPPLYIFPDMDWQPKYLPQGQNDFFADGRNDRPVVPGTIQRGYGWAEGEVFDPAFTYAPAQNPALYSGRNPDGSFYAGFPVRVDNAFLELGREKYDINCAVCHGVTGDGRGIIREGYNLSIVRNLLENPYVTAQPEGQLYTTIALGKGKMGPYGDRLTPVERWAVVAYLRALQLAGDAGEANVPPSQRAKLGLPPQ